MKKTRITALVTEDYAQADLEMIVKKALTDAGLWDVSNITIEYNVEEVRDVNPSGRAPFGWHI